MRRIILFVVLASLATIGSFSSASDNERVRTSYDQESQRQKLQELRQKLQQMQRDLDQQQGKLPRLVVPPPGQRDFFMKKAPLPPEDRSNWIPKQFNGQTFYTVP